jgi:peptidoglycan/LPS O-acetylase OafA/YrhL
MAKLKVFAIINDNQRNSSIDVFRGIAIIAVVLYHFNQTLPLGFIGVDLFFVISGLLIGGILIKEFKDSNTINFPKFFLQRGFKIWPSYYAFILTGSVLAYYFYRYTNPGETLPLSDMKRFLLFYKNYTGLPLRWTFGQVWSLCVEEHFYIALPLLLLSIQYFIPSKHQLKILCVSIMLSIIACIAWKYFTYFYRGHNRDTVIGTHNRIDALAWGVLLSIIISYHGEKLKNYKNSIYIFIAGVLLGIATIYFQLHFNYEWFDRVYLHAIMPFSFFLMLMGIYYVDLSRLTPLRFIAYYSYNWYLWHPLFFYLIINHLGSGICSLLIYLAFTFLVAMVTTVLIEEFFLAKRKKVINNIFRKR